jgi:hypothetical protein
VQRGEIGSFLFSSFKKFKKPTRESYEFRGGNPPNEFPVPVRSSFGNGIPKPTPKPPEEHYWISDLKNFSGQPVK